jgi:hypothetical protein
MKTLKMYINKIGRALRAAFEVWSEARDMRAASWRRAHGVQLDRHGKLKRKDQDHV